MYLTPHGAKYSKPSVSDLSEAGAPEIEVTPAMIEAGAEVVWAYFDEVIAWGSPSGRDLAKRVFAAMENHRKT